MGRQRVCLSIGGSDSCGGAGVQADLQVFAAHGIKGCSAITALTAQNPSAVTRIEPVSLAQMDAEIHAIFDYYDVAAVKTGMLLDAEHIAVISTALAQRHAQGPLIVDPVMVSSSGVRLLDAGAIDTLCNALLPIATMVTPNLDEAAVLLNRPCTDMENDCRELVGRLSCTVLLKGGHGDSKEIEDVLCDRDGHLTRVKHPRMSWDINRAHGSGCRLSAAIAAMMADGASMQEAVQKAVAWIGSGS